jgi:hypothetical protein
MKTTVGNHLDVDNWLVPVGGNPVPVVLSAHAVWRPGVRMVLLPSEQTRSAAERIQAQLKLAGIEDVEVGRNVDSRDPSDLYQACRDLLGNGKRWGVQYTAGTKAMSVAASMALHQASGTDTVLAYLDSQRDTLIVHGPDGRLLTDPIKIEFKPSLENLLALHGADFHEDDQSSARPRFEGAAQQLAILNSEDTPVVKSWSGWATHWLNRKKDIQFDKALADRPLSESGDKWRQALPILQRLAVAGIVGIDSSRATWQQIAALNKLSSPLALRDWVCGGWLEDWTLHCLLKAQSCGVDVRDPWRGVTVGVDQGPNKFEIDVLGVSGLRLLGITCTVDGGSAKTKLFEGLVRVGQIGGDESLCALVACVNARRVPYLKREADRILRPGHRLAVFGREHLPKLDQHIKNWLDLSAVARSQSNRQGEDR